MKKFKFKNILFYLLLACGYILVFAPYIYSIFYSMPANDDFAWAIDWWTDNRLLEAFHRIAYNYMVTYGNSGIVAIFIQIIFNPLHMFDNQGHSFGICMLIANLIMFLILIVSIKRIFKYLFKIEDDIKEHILTLLVTCLVTTSYYYSDVYNWWSGTPGYSLMLAITVATIAAIAKYLETKNIKDYVCLIILGVIACTSMMYDVAVGAAYVLLVFVISYKNGDSLKKKFLPLVLFVVTGIIQVIAPGNFTRMEKEDRFESGMMVAIIVTAKRIIMRFIESILSKPWILGIVIILVLLGILYNTNYKVKLINIILGIVAAFCSSFAGVLLYVYGQNKKIDSEFTPRILFVEDYILFITFAFAAFAFGCWIKQFFEIKINVNRILYFIVAVVLLFGGVTLVSGKYKEIIQIDIVEKKDIIKESYYFWDDILDEIVAAENGEDVVIQRKNITWNQYSYYSSLDDIPRPTLKENEKYGTCNQCAAKYYGVDTILVYLD